MLRTVVVVLIIATMAVPWSDTSTELLDLNLEQWLEVAVANVALGVYIVGLATGRSRWRVLGAQIGAFAWLFLACKLVFEAVTGIGNFYGSDWLLFTGYGLWAAGSGAALLYAAQGEAET